MKKNKIIKSISIIISVSMILSSCQLFPTQKMIDNIIPDHNIRMYTIADLMPYDYDEIKNARALYGKELLEYFLDNTATGSEMEKASQEKKNAFYKELMYRTHNYNILNERYDMYFADMYHSEKENLMARENEYNGYYKMDNAASIDIIKKYNDGEANGAPLMTIRAILSTASASDTTGMYTEVTCDIFRPVIITEKEYSGLRVGKSITLDMPIKNSTVGSTATEKRVLTYVGTDSLLYTDEKGKETYYFIADEEELNGTRRIINYDGTTVETYVETKPLQFMKSARVTSANDKTRVLNHYINNDLEKYDFDKIVERAINGGYLASQYQDYVYANSITTNLKGYITSLIEYTNQRIDNEYYKNVLAKKV